MATLTDVTDRDSGVASSEATPESQTLSPTTLKEAVKESTGEEAPVVKVPPPPRPAQDDDDDDDDDDEDVDESLGERLWGLTEMFPNRLRHMTVSTASTSLSLVKGGYDLTRQAVWLAVSTSVILFAPVMFELERLNVEEMMKQDRNRLVLGPGSAMSGPSTPGGLMPPPPAR